jgi:hypothetical protein
MLQGLQFAVRWVLDGQAVTHLSSCCRVFGRHVVVLGGAAAVGSSYVCNVVHQLQYVTDYCCCCWPQELLNPGQRQWLQLLCDRDSGPPVC